VGTVTVAETDRSVNDRSAEPGAPLSVRSALRAVARRYAALPRHQRPANVHDLLTADEAQALVRGGQYPPTPEALANLTDPARARRRRRFRRRVEAIVRDVLAAELPAALAVLLGREVA
jgi:hypothetical protein